MAQDGSEKLDKNLRSEMLMQTNRSCRTLCCMLLFLFCGFAFGVIVGIVIGLRPYYELSSHATAGVACHTSNLAQIDLREQAQDEKQEMQKSPNFECPRGNPVLDTRYENYIFSPLTAQEMRKVATFLLQQNIISTLDTPNNLSQNFILYQFLHPPIKAEALAYLDRGAEKPKRFAKVTVQRGDVSIPDVMEYKAGPLDTEMMTVVPLTEPGDIHFNSRPHDFLEIRIMTEMLRKEMKTLSPLISESFDGAELPDLHFNLINGPPSTNGMDRDTRWTVAFNGFNYNDAVDLIHILPLSGRVHNPGTNTTAWYTYDFHYLNQGPYRTAQELMDAYNKNEIRRVKLQSGFRSTTWERIFPKRNDNKPLRDKADMPGSRTYYPSGPRYEIRGTQVKWMGWSFEISGSQVRGPALFNVKFKDQRIIYEHALNDIALNYATDSHAQNNIVYADATYGILGGNTQSVVMSGTDCPEHGTVLNATAWNHVTQQPVNMQAFCIFEADGQEALWRHGGRSFEAGMRNRYLVIRAPVTIGNYDYIFDYYLYLDGKIFTYAKASGYIHASFWDAENPLSQDKTRDAFGYRLSEYTTGPIHDHMFGYKVDLDILDENNTFQIIKWKTGSVLDALKTQQPDTVTVPQYFIYNETRYIEWEKVDKETGNQNPREQQFWLVVNERERNSWGVERGYQISPLETASQALKEHPLLQALSFTKYHCAVTKRKEEEQTLTSIYDVNRMDNAQGHLEKQLNNENIIDEDIVTWVTVGFLHIPTSEDIPMTTRVQTGFLLKPFNFFDRTESFDMPQHVETRDGKLTQSEPKFESCAEPKTEYCRFC